MSGRKTRRDPIARDPNRPVDYAIADQLLRGDILHKGNCDANKSRTLGWGNRLSVRYIVVGKLMNETDRTFELFIVNEMSFEPIHLNNETAVKYHRLEDCASRVQPETYANRGHKPGPRSRNFVI